MKFLKGIFLVLIFFITPYIIGDSCLNKISASAFEITAQQKQKDIINFKKTIDNKIILSQQNNLQIETRKNDEDFGFSNNNFLEKIDTQLKDLISYIYTKAFLENKSELALLRLKHQKHTNAP